jgi:serine/threonine protein kinase
MSYPPDDPALRGALPSGTRLNDHYEIDGFIKAGGMGEVYRGHEIETGDAVAIKLVREQTANNEAMLGMFRNEALALRRIHHEAVVRYFGFTLEPHLRRHYLVMEFVEGTPLSDLLKSGPLSVSEVLALMWRLAVGLQAAHEQNVVHRDVSPDNVIVPKSGVSRSRIIDFGIARSLGVGDSTVIGSGFAGKYKYVSPEQLGLFGGDVRPASDVYSLGLVLAECLIGSPLAMDGSQFEIIENRRSVPDLSGVDPIMRPIIAAMLQPDPMARPTSMAEIARWSRQPPASRGETVFALPPRASPVRPSADSFSRAPVPPASAPDREFNIRKTAPFWFAAAAVGALALGAAAYGSWFLLHPNEKETTVENPEAPANTPINQAADPFVRLREFVRDFDGGDCFLAVVGANAGNAVEIDGFGRGREPFDALDKSFKDAIGVPAAISVRRVAAPQCPALAFAKRFLGIQDPPRFDVARSQLQRTGDRLEGAIETRADYVQFLVVDDDGLVTDLTSQLGQEPGRRDFAMNLRSSRSGPVLLVAIASARPFSITNASRSIPAKDLFSKLGGELAPMSPPPAVAVKYVLLVPGL